MSTEEQLKQIYTKFYEQRDVLTEAPRLTQAPDDAQFDREKADTELAGVISYLMGVKDIRETSFEQIIDIIQQHYENQPEWKALLVEYFEYTTEKEKESLMAQEDTLIQEIEAYAQKLLEEE